MFADDLATLVRGFSLKKIESKIQYQLNRMKVWSSKWRLKASIMKTKYIVFDKKRRRTPIISSNSTTTKLTSPQIETLFSLT